MLVKSIAFGFFFVAFDLVIFFLMYVFTGTLLSGVPFFTAVKTSALFWTVARSLFFQPLVEIFFIAIVFRYGRHKNVVVTLAASTLAYLLPVVLLSNGDLAVVKELYSVFPTGVGIGLGTSLSALLTWLLLFRALGLPKYFN